VQAAVTVLGVLEALHNVFLLQKLVILDCLVNSDDILPYDTTSTGVEMTESTKGSLRSFRDAM
jgi:hypothetical protein